MVGVVSDVDIIRAEQIIGLIGRNCAYTIAMYFASYSSRTDGLTDWRTDGRTEGNAISPFRNFVATGDKKRKKFNKRDEKVVLICTWYGNTDWVINQHQAVGILLPWSKIGWVFFFLFLFFFWFRRTTLLYEQKYFLALVCRLKSVGALKMKFVAPMPEQINTPTMHFLWGIKRCMYEPLDTLWRCPGVGKIWLRGGARNSKTRAPTKNEITDYYSHETGVPIFEITFRPRYSLVPKRGMEFSNIAKRNDHTS